MISYHRYGFAAVSVILFVMPMVLYAMKLLGNIKIILSTTCF